MAAKRNSPICFDADINLFAPVEEANNASNALTEGNTCTLPSTKVNLKSFILSEGPLQSNIRILTVCIQKTGNRKLLAFIKLSITSS